MGVPIVYFLYNHSQENLPNTGNESGDSRWKVLNPLTDKVAFLGDSAEDGDPITSKSLFSIPESGSQEVPRALIKNYASGVWDRVWLAGSNANLGGGGNYKYAFGAYIDGTSQSAILLQAWDSASKESYNLQVLGSGNPDDSMLRAVCTTYASPGNEWAGIPIAGDDPSNVVALTTGGIVTARMIYFNLRLLIPSTATPFADEPVLCLYITFQ
jgi:hypothetical protein